MALMPDARLLASRILRATQHSFHGLMLSRNRSTTSDAAFIGLGHMGGPMALNLARAGFRVHVFDKSEKQTNDFMSQAPKDLINNLFHEKSLLKLIETGRPPVIITMLPSSPQVLEVYGHDSKPDGLLSITQKDTLLIDCTTGDPEVARSISDHARSKNCIYIDAPVSGGVTAAQQAKLTFMVGGPKDAVDRATPLLKAMGSRIFHCGPIGTGLAAKICNNMLLAISMIGTSEAMELGQRLGLDPKILAEVINSSSGRCWSSEVYNPVPGIMPDVPASKNYTGGFGTALMTKDLGLAQAASTSTGSPIPLGSTAHQLYRILCQKGYANKDFSSVYEFLSRNDQSINS